MNRILITLVLLGTVFLILTASPGSSSTFYSAYIPLVANAEHIQLGSAIHPGFFADKRYGETLAKYDRVTPEVAGGYWYVVGSATESAYPPHGWADMDFVYQYAISNGKAIHSYPLRWWFPNATIQPPDITAWITEVMTRYPLITDWIVVNEGWDKLGNPTIPLIEESFVIAREVRPDAVLWYNGILMTAEEQAMAIGLVQDGLADAIGIQMHHSFSTGMGWYLNFLSWLDENDVPWAITELDVTIPENTQFYLNLQAESYRRVVSAYLEYDGLFIGMWGVSDRVSWLYDYFPLPFDREYLPKPAWFVLSANEE